MNILITLPKHLIDAILRGEKIYELRKSRPKNLIIGQDGFFAVEKGTSNVRCWCRVDKIYGTFIDHHGISWLESNLCVSKRYIEKYADGKKVCLWKIGKVIELKDLDRSSLFVDKNPQSYAYCQLSYGESY